MKRKILIVELWGLGDLTFAAPVIQAALDGNEVHLLGKEHARMLLEPSFPNLRFTAYEAPWTAYRGKYKLWKWRWMELIGLIRRLRSEKYDLAVSVRDDPRDQILMWLAGAKLRVGFVFEGTKRVFDMGAILLTRRLKRPQAKQHKVENWRQIGREIGLPAASQTGPHLAHSRYRSGQIDRLFEHISRPTVCLHTGARVDVRRWPEEYFAQVLAELRRHFNFHLIVIPEPRSPSPALEKGADAFLSGLPVRELVDVLGRVDLVLCNDSGPGHIAAACGRPVISIFGPSDPDWFRPWGEGHKVVLRDICPWRPCFDYCKFTEPYCMTKLTPAMVSREIVEHIRSLISSGKLVESLLKEETSLSLSGV
jgi:heptosyltransferase-2